MVEKIVQKEEEQCPEEMNRLFKLPKHIKQIGLGGNSPEIYIEDYAEGYLRRLAGSDYGECRVAVLVGEFIKAEGKRYVFIRGAIEAEEVIEDNTVRFTSEAWAGVYEKIKRYFPQYEAVGWFLGGPEFLTEVTDHIRQTHTDWFGGRDRVLYKIDPIEKEAVFYLYDKGDLKQWPGYCIYYEKNEEMQDYLVAGNPPSVDAGYQEPILAELGKRVGRKTEPEEETQEASDFEKKEEKKERTKPEEQGKKTGKSSSGRGTGIVAAVALLAVGAFALREREQPRTVDANSPTASATAVPTLSGTVGVGEPAESVSVHAGVTPTKEAPVTKEPEHSMFDGEFVPITEEPFVPGQEQEETVATQVPVKTTEEDTEKEPEAVMATENMTVYIVQNGDTLAGICRDFYGSTLRMEEVKGLNQIPDENRIYAGQELYLP